MQLFIGIDIGTSVSKGVVIDASGRILSCHKVLHEYSEFEDYSDAWWNEVIQIVQTLSRQIVDKTSIYSITISAMLPNLIMLDSRGNIAVKTRLYTDPFAIELQKEMDQADGTIWKNETLSKLVVLREKEKKWSDVAHILTTHCYIGYRFTGEFYCDYASAYEFGHVFDETSCRWNEKLLEKYNIDYRLLPPLVSPVSCIGIMSDVVADQLNLPSGIRIIAGSHDSIASMIGAGLTDKNDCLLYYGTFNCSAIIHDSIIDVLLGNVKASPIEWTSSIPDSGPQFTAMCRLFTGSEDYDQFDRMASQSQPGANGVLFMQNPNLLNSSISSLADGSFFHVRNETTIEDLCRAIYESFPYGVLAFWKTNPFLSKPMCFYAAGGGVRSNLRVQIVSDVLSIKQYKLNYSENAVGTALIGIAAYSKELFLSVQCFRREQSLVYIPNHLDEEKYKRMAEEYWNLLCK